MSYCMLVTTFDTKVEAAKIAKELLECKLAACCQIIPGVESYYMWKGEVTSSQEFIMQVKTKGYLVDKVEELIITKHSYDTPEIIKIKIDDGSIDYLKWIDCVTDKNSGIC